MSEQADNDDLDLDLDDTQQDDAPPAEEIKLGDQDDGSFVVEDDTQAKKEGADDVVIEEATDADAEKREQRRLERQQRRQRQKEKEERLRRELDQERQQRRQLEERMALVERRTTGAELAQIDDALNKARTAHDHYKRTAEQAMAISDAKAAMDAMEKMNDAKMRVAQLNNVKNAYQQRQQQPPPLDPQLVNHANAFMAKHTWYRPDGNDDDSSVTRAIDNKLAQEGWNPSTPAYWQELESRVAKYLPHRAKSATVQHGDGSAAQQKPRSPVAGSGKDSVASNAAKGTFKLSADRVQAMKDAGIWDNPEQRAEAIKRYRDYDRNNGRN